jgi:hypothetical protein
MLERAAPIDPPPASTPELRILAKPQLWLWWLNLVIQLPLGGMMLWLAITESDGGIGGRVFLGLLGLFCVGLWGFGVSVLARLRGAPLYVVVGATELAVPSMVRRTSVVVRYADMEKTSLQEINASGVSFFQLVVGYRVDGKKKSLVIAQQLVGREALDQVLDALAARGVPM